MLDTDPAHLGDAGGNETAAFRHEAFFYADAAEFSHQLTAFVRGGLERDEAVLLALAPEKIAVLRHTLGADADDVTFTDITSVGNNPARIIPVWRAFIDGATASNRGARGVGEPAWATRSAAALHECHAHEGLLNTAFDSGPAWYLVCPYDTATLAPDDVERARRTHPYVFADGESRPSPDYDGPLTELSSIPLPAPPPTAGSTTFAVEDLHQVRSRAINEAKRFGLDDFRAADVGICVSEAATNSIRHGGGHGEFFWWTDNDQVVFEVRDSGVITDPLIGRVRPNAGSSGGHGLWLVNQLCDLTQVRSSEAGTIVRIHMTRAAAA